MNSPRRLNGKLLGDRASVLECARRSGAKLPLSRRWSARGGGLTSLPRPAGESGGKPPHSKTLRGGRPRKNLGLQRPFYSAWATWSGRTLAKLVVKIRCLVVI